MRRTQELQLLFVRLAGSTMHKRTTRNTYAALAMLLLFPGCGLRCGDPQERTRNDEIDGGVDLNAGPECNQPWDDCVMRCWNRQASDACGGCCWDELVLCRTKQKYDFAYCDGAK